MSSIACLSVRQPWAWAIVHGHKPVENRTWTAEFRGRLLIHAGLTWDKAGREDFARLRIAFPEINWPAQYELGGIVGEVVMTDCIGSLTGPRPVPGLDMRWWTGPYGFVLKDAKPLPFAPFRGLQGFFAVPEEALLPLPPGAPVPRARYVPDDRTQELL